MIFAYVFEENFDKYAGLRIFFFASVMQSDGNSLKIDNF